MIHCLTSSRSIAVSCHNGFDRRPPLTSPKSQNQPHQKAMNRPTATNQSVVNSRQNSVIVPCPNELNVCTVGMRRYCFDEHADHIITATQIERATSLFTHIHRFRGASSMRSPSCEVSDPLCELLTFFSSLCMVSAIPSPISLFRLSPSPLGNSVQGRQASCLSFSCAKSFALGRGLCTTTRRVHLADLRVERMVIPFPRSRGNCRSSATD